MQNNNASELLDLLLAEAQARSTQYAEPSGAQPNGQPPQAQLTEQQQQELSGLITLLTNPQVLAPVPTSNEPQPPTDPSFFPAPASTGFAPPAKPSHASTQPTAPPLNYQPPQQQPGIWDILNLTMEMYQQQHQQQQPVRPNSDALSHALFALQQASNQQQPPNVPASGFNGDGGPFSNNQAPYYPGAVNALSRPPLPGNLHAQQLYAEHQRALAAASGSGGANPSPLSQQHAGGLRQLQSQLQQQQGHRPVGEFTPDGSDAWRHALAAQQQQQQSNQLSGFTTRSEMSSGMPLGGLVAAMSRGGVMPGGEWNSDMPGHRFNEEEPEFDPKEEARRRNREAQQRFRERQREAAREAEEKSQRILSDLNSIRAENKRLAARLNLLATALAVRDCILAAFNPTASKGGGMVLNKKNILVSLVAGDEQIEHVIPDLNEPLDKESLLKASDLKNITAYATNYRQFQVEIQYAVENAETLEKAEPRDEDAIAEAWKEVIDTFNKTFKILRYHCIEDMTTFRKAILATTPKVDVPGQIEEENQKSQAAAARVLKDARVRENLHEMRAGWSTYGQTCTLIVPRVIAAQKALAEESLALTSLGRRYNNMHDAAAAALRCAQAASEMQVAADEFWEACYKLSVSWFMTHGPLGLAKINCETMPYMPNWRMLAEKLLLEAVDQQLIESMEDANVMVKVEHKEVASG